MTKRLYKSTTDKVIAGVCGGIGEYFDTDPVVVRLGYLLLTVFTGVVPGVVGYIIAIVIIPDAPDITPIEPESAHDDTAL